jgi:enoyl reductase-like protein
MPISRRVELKCDQSTKLFDMVLREEHLALLHLQVKYRPDTGYPLINEVSKGRSHRVNDFYQRLWLSDHEITPEIDILKIFTSPEVTIRTEDIDTFCDVIGNPGVSFRKAHSANVSMPMDFAIVVGWQSVMKVIFLKAMDGDLLRLVHISSGFRMVDDLTTTTAGDNCVGPKHRRPWVCHLCR